MKEALRSMVRCEKGRAHALGEAVLDSQAIQIDAHGGTEGCDAGKKTMGRNCIGLIDTLGMLLGVAILPANTLKPARSRLLLDAVLLQVTSLRKLLVDDG